MLASDLKSTKEEMVDANGLAGCCGVYPRRCVVPPYFEANELTSPLEETVTKRTAFGTYWGLIYFKGDDSHTFRDLLKRQEDLDFYV